MTSQADRLELRSRSAACFATREEPAAIDHLTEAVGLAEGDADVAPRQLLELRQLLAAQCMLHDRYDLAVEQLLLVRARMPRGSMERCYVDGAARGGVARERRAASGNRRGEERA